MPAAVKSVLSNYVNFSGRAARSELWWYTLALLLLSIGLALIEGAVLAPILGMEPFAEEMGRPLQLISSLAFLLPSLAVIVRRLHDIDRSGWWYFIILIPIAGPLILLYWYIKPGTEGANQYGDDPLIIQ